MIRDAQEAMRSNGVQLQILKAGNEGDFESAFSSLVRQHTGALAIGSDPLFNNWREAARGAGGTPCGSGDLRMA